jgi:hypothetical protein
MNLFQLRLKAALHVLADLVPDPAEFYAQTTAMGVMEPEHAKRLVLAFAEICSGQADDILAAAQAGKAPDGVEQPTGIADEQDRDWAEFIANFDGVYAEPEGDLIADALQSCYSSSENDHKYATMARFERIKARYGSKECLPDIASPEPVWDWVHHADAVWLNEQRQLKAQFEAKNDTRRKGRRNR